MCMLPFSWCLLRRSDQVIPRIIKLEHCTVRDEINITKSSPLADESTVPGKKPVFKTVGYSSDDELSKAARKFCK